jgi:hypothetical protein
METSIAAIERQAADRAIAELRREVEDAAAAIAYAIDRLPPPRGRMTQAARQRADDALEFLDAVLIDKASGDGGPAQSGAAGQTANDPPPVVPASSVAIGASKPEEGL